MAELLAPLFMVFGAILSLLEALCSSWRPALPRMVAVGIGQLLRVTLHLLTYVAALLAKSSRRAIAMDAAAEMRRWRLRKHARGGVTFWC